MSDNHQVNDQETSETPSEEQRGPFNEFLHHQQRAFEEAGKAFDALIPPGFKEHGQEAGREFVSSFKVLVDAAINELEKASKEFDKNFKRSASDDSDRPSSTGTTKVKVQVD
jgi:hypothetical protein